MIEKGELLRGVWIAVLCEIDSCGDDTLCVHAEGNGFKLPEAAQEQTGSREKNQGNSNLRGDQQLAKRATRRGVVLFSGEQFWRRTTQRGSQSEEGARQKRYAEREQQHANIDLGLFQPRDALRRYGYKEAK